jgi:DNA-binding MarR family transcriptional regulator
MKKNDYICVQAPMISDLNLAGKNELLLFAMIWGYSKDGKSTCRVSLSYMQKWLKTSHSAVVRTLNDLEEAGYINRHEYLEGKVKCNEYTTNYDELLARAAQGEYISLEATKKAKKASKKQGGLKMRPATEGPADGGSQNETGLKMIQRGSHFDTKSGLTVRPNSNNIINYNNFYSSRTREEQEEEKKEFFKIFFFRNAADPAAEVERFVAYNESRGWQTSQGVVYDTPEKRRAMAVLWEIKDAKKRCSEEFLRTVENIYNEAGERGVEGRDILLDPRMTFAYDKTADKMVMTASSADVWKWIEAHLDIARFHIMPLLNGKGLSYRLAK